mmetsp:Transcript_21903/g.65499  ORF Transcript_21903/g.65499 Transcript_21903/m.65499 type:complete len:174 (-) Transcript_21903:59-580(-)
MRVNGEREATLKARQPRDTATQTTIVMVRHGKTEWSHQGRYQGQLNSDLLPASVEATESLGARIRADRALNGISAVYASDLGQTRHTAEVVMLSSDLADAGVPLCLDRRLRETHLDDLQGKLAAECADPYAEFMRRWTFVPIMIWSVSMSGRVALWQQHHVKCRTRRSRPFPR